MRDEDRENALLTLRELGDEFLTGSKNYAALNHVLVQAGWEDHPKLRLLPPACEARLGAPLFGKYGEFAASPRLPAWRHQYYGADAGIHHFRMKATAAAKALIKLGRGALGLTSAVADGHPRMKWAYADLLEEYGSLGSGNEAEYWLLVVHLLAWQHPKDSSFSARRIVWETGVERTYEAPYDPDEFRRELARYAGAPPECLRQIEQPTDYFCSILTDEVFRCSKLAIDSILALNGEESGRNDRNDPLPALSVHPNQPIVTLDGQDFVVSEAQAAYVRAHIAAKGEWLNDKMLMQLSPVIGTHGSRVCDQLPDPLNVLFEKKKGSGQRLKRREVE